MGRRRGRYLSVLRGSDEVARNRLFEYFRGDRQVSYPERSGPRDEARDIWILPFNLGTPATYGLRQQVNSVIYPSVSNFVRNFAFVTAPPVSQRILVSGLLADRAAITIQRNGSGTRRTSQLTGKTYTSYGGQSIVVPFGRSTVMATGGPEDTFQVIFNRCKEADPSNLCSFIPSNFGLT